MTRHQLAIDHVTQKPIRMLFLVREAFPTYRVDVDVLFGRELLGRGHQIDFVMQADSAAALSGPIIWRGRTVYLGRSDQGKSKLRRLHRHWLGFWNDLRCLSHAGFDRYDAIQVRDKFATAALALAIARFKGLKFFFWLSFPEPEAQLQGAREGTARFPIVNHIRGRLFGWLLYRWILPHCDHAFVQSEQMRQDLGRRRIDLTKLTPVPMGIDISRLPAPVPHKHVHRTSGNDPLLLGYLGTLNRQRKLGVLVEMLAIIRSEGREASLLFVGDGEQAEDRRSIIDLATSLGVQEYVEITGFLPRDAALQRIMQVDIALSPFFPTMVLNSTSPTKLVEYLALGLAVVASRHPEQRAILRATRAGVCVPWHPRHFARAALWIANQTDAVRTRMGERGRTWVLQNRDYARIADAVEQKYAELLH